MSYQSTHTGPEVDAAVTMLGDIRDARDATAADRQVVETLAPQVEANAQAAENSSSEAALARDAAAQSAQDAQDSAQAIENTVSTDGSVSRIVRATKEEYAAITPDPRTLYFVVE